jgi:hypothetical protein
VPLITIGDFVWIDQNQPGTPGAGIQAPGDAPVVNVAVQLESSTGTILFKTTTDNKGLYKITSANYFFALNTPYFVSIPMGDSAIAVPQLTPVVAFAGNNPALDSNGVLNLAVGEVCVVWCVCARAHAMCVIALSVVARNSAVCVVRHHQSDDRLWLCRAAAQGCHARQLCLVRLTMSL